VPIQTELSQEQKLLGIRALRSLLHDLVDGKLYGGHLFHTHELRESADLVDLVFSGIEWKTFKAEELQKFAANRIRLYPRLG
jgi:hypothetical protein